MKSSMFDQLILLKTVAKQFIKSIIKGGVFSYKYTDKGKITGIDEDIDINLLIKKEKPVCFDVGANKGQSIEHFKKIFTAPIIYSFEPSSKLFAELKKTNFGKQVQIYDFALGSKNSSDEFINYRKSGLSSFLTLDDNPENRFRENPIISKEIVEVKTLDWFVQEHKIELIDLLKIDTQGFDIHVLRGATDSLRRGLIKNIFIEINFVKLYQNQGMVLEIYEFLEEFGMHLVDFYDKSREGQRLAWCNALFSLTTLK